MSTVYLHRLKRKNLQLIQQLEKELKSNPEAYIHEEQRYMVIAGLAAVFSYFSIPSMYSLHWLVLRT